jgi:hypothetical protein
MTADCPTSKALLEQESKWTTVIAGKVRINGHHFMVMAQAVKISRVDPKEQAKFISSLEAQNPSLKSRVIVLHVAWCSPTFKRGKMHGPLLIEVRSHGEANILVQEGLLHEGGAQSLLALH